MTSEDFIEIMDELGRRIEGPAQEVFELAVRQVYINLVIAFIFFIASLILVMKLVPLALKKRQEWQTKYEKEKSLRSYVSSYEFSFFENETPLAVSASIATGGAFIASINLLISFAGVLNPGWKALTLILETIT